MQHKGVCIATMLLLALVAVSASRPKGGSGGHCICTEEYAPVCGVNGQTYSNSCYARCAHARVACNQECPCPCEYGCPKVYRPVCGENGKQYDNKCLADCAHVDVKCNQKCPCPTCEDGCPKIYRPVCGANGKQYGNKCLADCAHVDVKCYQKCPCPTCEDGCPKIYHPVCGENGKQYDSECLAKCAGTTVACTGHCPCKPTCVGEGGQCLRNPSHFKKCCRGLECCPNHSVGNHVSINGVCKHSCGSYKG